MSNQNPTIPITINSTATYKAMSELDITLSKMSSKALSQAISTSIEPLVDTIILSIRPTIKAILVDYVIDIRKKLLSKDEFVSVKLASSMLDIQPSIIYDYIAKGIIELYTVNKVSLVSISQIKTILNAKNKLKNPRRYVYSIMSDKSKAIKLAGEESVL